jgi:predicted acylesterase/phospholipase RssA
MSNLPSAYIAFQGGGALGMAHLGAWQEVSQQFNIIGTAGTSAGSIVSALCAAKFHPVHAIDLFHQLNWSDFVNRQSFLKLFTELDGYSDGKLFHKWLRDQLGKYVSRKPYDITFADLYQFSEIYLAIIACDINNQKSDPVVFDRETEPHTTISFAVRASISIHGLTEGRNSWMVDFY